MLRKEDELEGSKEERRKAKKETKKRKGVLSFDVGEDGEDESEDKNDEKKRRKKEVHSSGRTSPVKDDVPSLEEADWVEKPAVKPRFVGRKGAADYM